MLSWSLLARRSTGDRAPVYPSAPVTRADAARIALGSASSPRACLGRTVLGILQGAERRGAERTEDADFIGQAERPRAREAWLTLRVTYATLAGRRGRR